PRPTSRWSAARSMAAAASVGTRWSRSTPTGCASAKSAPSVFDLAQTEEQRQIWSLWAAPNKIGRPFFAPPGMAEDRAALMRAAFDATLADPELRAEAARMNLAVEATSGRAVEALLRGVYATPKAVVEKAALASKGR